MSSRYRINQDTLESYNQAVLGKDATLQRIHLSKLEDDIQNRLESIRDAQVLVTVIFFIIGYLLGG